MKAEFKHTPPIPYSLHDMRVSKISISDSSISFAFENGYVRLAKPCKQVGGTLTIEGVDFDFVSVRLLSKNGAYGRFKGEKLTLPVFLQRCDWSYFEIVNVLYGYNKVTYSGFLCVKGQKALIEMDISVYFVGNIVYDTDEPEAYQKMKKSGDAAE